ncbi:hypothetical protein BY458DRAFT_145777 [Sporodiniella umbellata]|nr:hypothetical protein BY458DRAFT_145777 [Sporodiniella umbellata]
MLFSLVALWKLKAYVCLRFSFFFFIAFFFYFFWALFWFLSTALYRMKSYLTNTVIALPLTPSDHKDCSTSKKPQMSEKLPRGIALEGATQRSTDKIPKIKHFCDYPGCRWAFKRYEHLKRHQLVHTGERPHGCAYPGCGKRFSRLDNFHAHVRTHRKKADLLVRRPMVYASQFIHHQEETKIHSFICSQCKKSFCHPEKLRQHTILHLAQSSTPFLCSFAGCFQSFSTTECLIQHKKKHSPTSWLQ